VNKGKNKKKFLLFFFGIMLVGFGGFFSYFGYEAEKAKNIPKSSAFDEFLKANEAYREDDSRFWGLVNAAEKPNAPETVNIEELKASYVSYVRQLDSLNLKNVQDVSWLWQVWNNKANAEVYQVFLGMILKEDPAMIKKLAKSALDDYLTSLKNCGNNVSCMIFVGQNIDWLTRVPPSNKDGKGEGQGLGNLFGDENGSAQDGSSSQEGDKLPFYIPGASPGKSIKGAH